MLSGVYRHYMGGLYQVLGVAQHTETRELMVVYVSLTGADAPGPRMRCRPLHGPDGFLTPISEDTPNAESRYSYIGDSVIDLSKAKDAKMQERKTP